MSERNLSHISCKLLVTLESVLKLSYLLSHDIYIHFCMPSFMIWWVRQCEEHLSMHNTMMFVGEGFQLFLGTVIKKKRVKRA